MSNPMSELPINQIICGDCLEVMKDWPDNCVDLVLTDPPYNVSKDYTDWNDNRPQQEYWAWYKDVLTEIYRVLKRGYLYISCTTRQKYIVKPLLEKIGFDWIQDLTWFRPNLTGGTRLIKLPWNVMHEPILLFKKGKRIPMLNEVRGWNTHDVFTYPAPQRNWIKEKKVHVTQKPIMLYLHILARTPGNTMLDPFMGVGTSLVAARYWNKKYIGIDISPKYCRIAEQRLESVDTGVSVRELTKGQKPLFPIERQNHASTKTD